MKKLYFLFLSIGILLTGCQFSENLYINDDGTGKMSLVLDGSEMMKMSGSPNDLEKTIDSTIVFKEFLKAKKDSISQLSKEEQESLKSLESFTMHTKVDPATQEMKVDMFTDFKNVDELQDVMAAMSKANSFGNKEEDKDNMFSSLRTSTATEMEYSFKNGIFKRKAIIADNELHHQALDSIGEAQKMFASSSYVLNYHFPKPIKSVSNENALFSADKKSFTLEISFLEYLKNPEILNLEVKLEK